MKPFGLLLLLVAVQSFSQKISPVAKYNSGLKYCLSTGKFPDAHMVKSNGEKLVSLFIEVSKPTAFDALRKKGAALQTIAGTIATANIHIEDIPHLAEDVDVLRIELPPLLQHTDDKMKKMTQVQAVHDGLTPLERSYKGQGVMLGIIDDGLDITHPEFYTNDTTLRIQSLWNMNYGYAPPQGFNYGTEWTADSLKSNAQRYKRKELNYIEMDYRFGGLHGTPVTGLAAGNSGVAPKADVVMVSIMPITLDSFYSSSRLLDGINYILQKANAAGQNCVINISMGANEGLHDGSTLIERAMDSLCAHHTNLLLCLSAGNGGTDYKHWGTKAVRPDSTYGLFQCAYAGQLYFYIPRKYRDSLRLSIAESTYGNLQPKDIFFQSPFYTIDTLVNAPYPVRIVTYKGNETKTYLDFIASPFNAEYDEIVLKVTSAYNSNDYNPQLYRFIFKGKGEANAWYPFWNLHPYVYPFNNTLADDSTFVVTDNSYSIVVPANGSSTLVSGAYNMRSCYVNIRNEVVSQYPVGEIAYFSSRGPTLDGRIKPDILSPGDNVLAPMDRVNVYYGHQFVMDSSWEMFGGTSAASPITAGAAVLLWERFPELTGAQIKERLKATTRGDAFTAATGDMPNNVSGWGKLDVFNAMTGVSLPDTITGINDICIGATQPPPPPDPVILPSYFKIYPNPTQGTMFLEYSLPNPGTISIYNSVGQLVKRQFAYSSPTQQRTININLWGLGTGLYYLSLEASGFRGTQPFLLTE